MMGAHDDPEGDPGHEQIEQEADLKDQRHPRRDDKAGHRDAVLH